MMTKRCSKCKETKPVEGFNRYRRAKDGLRSRCKECERDETAAWYAANPERKKAASAAWRAANPDKAKAASAAWRAANPERKKAASAAQRAGGRDPDKPWPDRLVGYDAAHRRVEAIYGPARNHDCLHCDGSAAERAYDYNDPDEFSGPIVDNRRGSSRIMRWSGKPQHYMPLCKGCHTKHDQTKGKAA